MTDSIKAKLQPLFTESLLQVDYLNPQQDNTNDAYLVTTANEKIYVVKALKNSNINRTPFWQGLNLLFNKTVADSIHSQTAIAEFLNKLQIIAAPTAIQTDHTSNNSLQTPYVIMTKAEGQPILPGSDIAAEVTKNKDIAYQLGFFLSKVHEQQFDYFGNMSDKGVPLNEFPNVLAETMRKLATNRKAQQDPEVQKLLPHYCALAREMQPPTSAEIIMLDLWPQQFLLGDNALSALIDLESYVIGPIALELVLIELWLGPLVKFKEGYLSTGAKWPAFEDDRDLYRFFLYLLYGCPDEGLTACLDSRNKFSEGEKVRSRISAPRPRPGGYSNPSGPGF